MNVLIYINIGDVMILYIIRYIILSLIVKYRIRKILKNHNSANVSFTYPTANKNNDNYFNLISQFNISQNCTASLDAENRDMGLNYDDLQIDKINFENSYISPIAYSHLPDVVNIEEISFGSPWSKDEFLESIRHCMAYGVFVMLDNHKILAGYIFYVNVGDELMITNIAVHPKFRRRGLGTKLIESKITSRFRKAENWRPRLKISTTTFNCDNLLASLFFKSLGYKWVNTIKVKCDKGYYEEYENYVLKMTYEDFINKYNKDVSECEKS